DNPARHGEGKVTPPTVEQLSRKALAEILRRRLLERRRDAASAGRPDTTPIREAIVDMVDRELAVLAAEARAAIAELVIRETVGLGPLEPLMADTEIDEILVNGPGEVYVERGGRIEPVDVRF